ncbi:unnamed protein product [Caenorhabditis angaria]|uniref:Ig-like domain-containing protein n=1 Tax=Caenorhabditis angaria TaxID=860376 RepID=A0A9P1N5I9_9PELO|nr:unnamed protein product [Caenorhabditis angaria]
MAPAAVAAATNLVPNTNAPTPSTTTLSTIAVRAGVNASIVVALLKSADYVQLRVDEMQPKLLEIGANFEETSDLLRIHEDLLARLRDKDDQVQELLNRTDGLGAEKTDEKETIVYDEMAKNLRETWRSLNRQLILRSYLLRETLQFYKMASTHEKLTTKTLEIIGQLNANNADQIRNSVDKLVNDIIDTTATVVELGSSVISQIRTLGQIDDNEERPIEILKSCVLIETVMLRVASDWERSENIWEEKKNIQHTTTTTTDELVVIEQWLEYAEKRVKALNENGQKNVLNEGNKHVARLHDLAQSPSSDGGRISHLSGRIEEFLHYLKTRMGRSQRIQQFIQAAKTMLSQLNMMVGDMKSANSAMAGELAPLAKQKAHPLIHEGKDISAKEVMSYEEQRLVKQYVSELEEKLREIEDLAKQRVESDKTNSQVSGVFGWLDGYAQAFLAQKGDMGGNLNDAREFVQLHKNFAAEVSNKDQEVIQLLSKKGSQLSSEENEQLDKLATNYETLKTIIENRIQIGTTYEQVHKFGKDLEGSFDALQTLLENNQEYTNEKVAAQISNVFQMIQDTLNQEKHQGEKFISNATQIGKSDAFLNIQRAQESVRNLITDHENRYKYVHHKWMSWQSDKDAEKKVEKIIEEIQMWQTDVLEFISTADQQTFNTKNEVESVQQKIIGFQNALLHNTAQLEQLKTQTESEEQISRINVLIDKQEYIKTRLEQLQQKIETTALLKIVEDVQIWQEEMVEIIRNLNHVVSTQINNQEQFENTRRKIEDLKVEVDKKSEHLEAFKNISQNQTYQTQLQKTIHNQETIQKTTHELQQKLEISQLIKVVQEVQMWQEEAIEIIRMFDRQEPKTIQDANELIDKVEEFKNVVEEKSKKIQEIKTISRVPEFVNKMEEVEHVQEQIHHLTVELQEKVAQQKLTKVTENIQMWQEEMIEIIRMFDSTPMKTIQECEELQEKVKLVREAIDIQQPKIDEVVTKATDINVRTHISKVIEQQNHIRQLAEHLERKAITATIELSKPQQTVEETKTIELTSLETTKIQLTPEEKKELQILRKTIEEIQMWQEDIIEIIRLITAAPVKTIQESESLVQRVNEITQTVEAQSTRIAEAAKFTKDEQHTESVTKTMTKQEQVKQLVKELHERAAAQNYVFRQQIETRQHVQAPQILTRLEDSEVDEGCKFEFAARIEGEPEPVISWLKDGIDVKSNIDYRQEYVNGVATLVIEESFIEDTARYTVKATNDGGVAESSANLVVKSRSAMSSAILEEDKPRFVKQLQNVQVTEGGSARLDCVVVGKPEPEVTWFKEETAVVENERVHFEFSGDHCQMIIDRTVPLDTGVYTVKAKNVHGEVANFCQLRVAPQKTPKPYQRPPSIQPALTNTVWEEGSTATLKVFTHGEPKPRVHWKFNDSPLQSSSQVQISEQEDGWSKVTIQQISPVHAGMYTAIAENEIGEAVTGATVHVQPSINKSITTTMEHHLQEDLNETIGQPIQKTVVTKTNQEYEQRQRQDFPQPREPEKIVEDKRWVEVIEQHFEEHLSQKSMSPIPQVFERKKIETQQRWVDTIDEIWSPQPTETIITETRNNSRMDHFSSHSVHEPSPKPLTYQTTTTSNTRNVSHIGQSHQPVQPVIGNTTTTNESIKTMNIAKIRQSPQPEVHEARTTPAPASEHVAAIRKTPVRETHQSTITHAPSLENIAKIRQSPVPETHKSTLTRRSPSVENVAKIRQSPAPETHISTITRRSPSVENAAKIRQSPVPEQFRSTLTRQSPSVENIAVQQPAQQPESHRATTVGGQPIANIAQIHNAPLPEVQGVIREAPKIDRIDDILMAPKDKIVITTVEQTVTTTGDIDKRYQEQEQKQSHITTTVTQGEEGWIQHKHQDFQHPEQSTSVTKKLNIEESENIRSQREIQGEPEKQIQTVTKKTEEEEELRRQQELQAKREPQTTTTVTETTSGEGWIQNVHQDMQQPHLSTVTVKKLGVEENELIQQNQNVQQPKTTKTTKTREELEEEERIRQQSKIPIRREPVTTVTETTSGEGWVQQIHQQPETSTVTVKRLDIEAGGSSESKIPMRRGGPRPVSIRQTDEETSIRQRDSFAAASEVEGFWTDGAYTASPTPPPVPIHRTTAEDNMQRIGLSRTTTEPEFIKFFEKEYTVEEGGRIAIECILVGNPKPWTRVFFNNRQITEKSEFLKICHVNDTYSIIISPARLEHAGYYKIIAENKRGVSESLTVLHVRPRSIQTYQQQKKNESLLHQQTQDAKNSEFTTVEEEFAMFEYEQRRPLKHESSKLVTPPPAKRIQQEHRSNEEHLETYDMEGKKPSGHPPHFTQTLVSTVIAQGDNTKFEGIVTGWPAPTVEWTVDGQPLTSTDIKVSNIGGRVSLTFPTCQLSHAGKYMCTAKNSSGVATSSAQLVVRPKTIAPDFIQRLISEEVEEGVQLKWTVRVTGDPMPKVTWLRDGYEIPDCDEVRIVDHGDGYHSLIIVKVESADSGQFTCLAENIAGEARSTADLVVRQPGAQPGNYFHVTKVTQEKQAKGSEPQTTSAFAIETPRQSEML